MSGGRGKYLDHSRTRTSCDDSSSCADIEGIVSISSRADDIHHEILVTAIDGRGDRSGPQKARSGRQRFRSSLETGDMKGGEECTDLRRVGRPWRENMA